MSIGYKTSLVILLIFGVLGIFNYLALTQIILPAFMGLELDDAKRNATRLSNTINDELDHLQSITADWAQWDLTYGFAKDQNPKFIAENLTPTLKLLQDLKLDVLLIVNQNKKLIWSAVYNKKDKAIVKTHFLFQSADEFINLFANNPDTKSNHQGIVPTKQGPLLVSTHSILNNQGEGPARGILIFGQLLNPGVATSLIKQTQVEFEYWPIGKNNNSLLNQLDLTRLPKKSEFIVKTENTSRLSTFLFIEYLYGDGGILLKISTDRPILTVGNQTINLALVTHGILFLIIMTLLFVFMRTVITHPLRQLTHTISAINVDRLTNTTVSGLFSNRRDEIGALSSKFGHLLNNLAHNKAQLESQIVERKQVESTLRITKEKYKEIFDASIAAIYRFDTNNTFVDSNPAGLKLLGYSIEELQNLKIVDIDDNPESIAKIYSKICYAKPIVNYEHQLIQKSGNRISVINNSQALLDEAGVFIGIQTTLVDISDLKQSEKAQQDLEKQLHQIQKMQAIGQLTGGIAHDFNNILAVIHGYTTLALQNSEESGKSKQQQYLNEITESVNRASKLVDELLLFSRGGTGKPVNVSIADTVTKMANLLTATLPSSVEFQLNIENHLPPILIDPTQLEQVIMNLCINARDAMDEVGSLYLAISQIQTADSCDSISDVIPLQYENWFETYGDSYKPLAPDTYILLSVSDSGHGIPVDSLSKIFEPFYTTKNSKQANGIGLAVVHGIVQQASGRMIVESKQGKGTAFKLLFKAQKESSLENFDGKLIESPPFIPFCAGHILVVDDETSLLAYMSEMLSVFGYTVDSSPTGKDALYKFENTLRPFDLVITDQTMPEVSSIELSIQLLKENPNLPIILCTGYSKLVDQEQAQQIGIRSFMSKPINPQTLHKTIQELLNSDTTSY